MQSELNNNFNKYNIKNYDFNKYFKNYTDEQIHELTFEVAKKEQAFTLQVLYHLREIELRRIYAKKGYSSLWEYAVKALGYSEPGASERCNAMRLMFSVDSVKEKLEKGEISFSVAAQVQRFFQTQKKQNKDYTGQEKENFLKQVSGKSVREVQAHIAKEAPQMLFSEKERVLTPEASEIRFVAHEKLKGLIKRIRELKGPLSFEAIFELALSEYIARHDPMEKASKAQCSSEDLLLKNKQELKIQEQNLSPVLTQKGSEKVDNSEKNRIKNIIKNTAKDNTKCKQEQRPLLQNKNRHNKNQYIEKISQLNQHQKKPSNTTTNPIHCSKSKISTLAASTSKV